MKLFQWGFGHQPHYVAAEDFAAAEKAIQDKYGPFHKIERIEFVSEYVLLPETPVCGKEK